MHLLDNFLQLFIISLKKSYTIPYVTPPLTRKASRKTEVLEKIWPLCQTVIASGSTQDARPFNVRNSPIPKFSDILIPEASKSRKKTFML